MANGSGGELIKRGRVDAFTADEIAVSEAVHEGYKDLVDTAQYKFVMPGSGIPLAGSMTRRRSSSP